MNPDADAMAENAERGIQEMKKKPIPVSEQEDEADGVNPTALDLTKVKSLRAFISSMNGTTYVTTTNKPKKTKFSSIATTAFNGFDILGGNLVMSGGSGAVSQSVPEKDTHHDKGICQESYDQGYEDGLKAAKEGDTRIK